MDSIVQQQEATPNNNVDNPPVDVQSTKPKKNKKAERKRECRAVTNSKLNNKSPQKNAKAEENSEKKRKPPKGKVKKEEENKANFTVILKRENPEKANTTEEKISSLKSLKAGSKNDDAVKGNNFPSTSLNASDEQEESVAPTEMKHLQKLTEEHLEILRSHFIVPLTKKSQRFERAILYCRACDNHINSLHHTVCHIRETGHIKLVKKKSSVELIQIIPEPTQFHYKILHDNLCDLALINCRSLSDYEKFDAIAAILTTVVRSRILNDNDAYVRIYGTGLSLLALKNTSNLNLELVCPENKFNTAYALTSMHEILKELKLLFHNVKADFGCKWPYISFEMVKSDAYTDIKCVLSVRNKQAFQVNQFIRVYSVAFPAFRIIAACWRLWAKACRLDNFRCGSIPAYVFDLMLIHFLQNCQPPLLPILHRNSDAFDNIDIAESESENYETDIQKITAACAELRISTSPHEWNLGQIFVQILKYYAIEDRFNTVATVRTLKTVTKDSRAWSNRGIAVEDPFMPSKNVAQMTPEMYRYFQKCVQNSYKFFMTPQTAKYGSLFKFENDRLIIRKSLSVPLYREKVKQQSQEEAPEKLKKSPDLPLKSVDIVEKVRKSVTKIKNGLTHDDGAVLAVKFNALKLDATEIPVDRRYSRDILFEIYNNVHSGYDFVNPRIDCISRYYKPKRSQNLVKLLIEKMKTRVIQPPNDDEADDVKLTAAELDYVENSQINDKKSIIVEDCQSIVVNEEETSPDQEENDFIVEKSGEDDGSDVERKNENGETNDEEDYDFYFSKLIKPMERNEISENCRDILSKIYEDLDVQDLRGFPFTVNMFLCGEKMPKIVCENCQGVGHLSNHCETLDACLGPLENLPRLNTRYVTMMDFLIKNISFNYRISDNRMHYQEIFRQSLESKLKLHVASDVQLFLFGSSCNGFGFSVSDLDLCLTFEKFNSVPEHLDARKIITTIANVLRKDREFRNVLPVVFAKVPIVRFYSTAIKLEGDISLYNILALRNTQLLYCYAMIDERARALGHMVKVFAKYMDIGDASRGSLSSYAYIIMMTHYLQQCTPPVLPMLQQIGPITSCVVDKWETYFYSNVMNLKQYWPCNNNQSLAELWLGFLRYYTEIFDFRSHVVQIRRSTPPHMTKFEKEWTNKAMAIEDPFELTHNLSSGISRRMFVYILKIFRKARLVFGKSSYGDQINSFLGCNYRFRDFEQFIFTHLLPVEEGPPRDRLCRRCSHVGHFAEQCPMRSAAPTIKALVDKNNKSNEKVDPSNSKTAGTVVSPKKSAVRTEVR